MTRKELIRVNTAMMETMNEKMLNTIFHVILGLRGASAYQAVKNKTLRDGKIHRDKQ